ncbi:glycoside hydrolase superfamily [Bisporella sp. PMI_857]|nr:glycoside hydrolase superfamily [Bisporella sp. PMI_857]
MFLRVLTFVLSVTAAATIRKKDVTGHAMVYLAENTGQPLHRASGILYGFPENETQIPDHFFTDIGYGLAGTRTGGGQLPEPLRGWTWGYDEFMGRYNSFVHNYHTSRRFGGPVQLLIHDLWGVDFYSSFEATPLPGDNGDWAPYDSFLTTLFQHLIADNVIDGLYWDIWNEPDGSSYYGRGLDRYLDVFGHTYHRIVNEFPNPKTVGPSFGYLPNKGKQDWYVAWANFIAANNSVPTWISMHFLEDSGDLAESIAAFQSFLQPAGINYNGPFMINEYGSVNQQPRPANVAWSIAQIERHDALGLRANWRGGYELHDYMANLLGKPHTYPDVIPDEAGYWPTSSYQVYKYYNLNMTGHRVKSSMTDDGLGDVYATVGSDKVRILSGVRTGTGEWAVGVRCLSCVGLPTSGNISVHTYSFNAGGLYERFDAPQDLGVYVHSYDSDDLWIIIGQNDEWVSYAFEFEI